MNSIASPLTNAFPQLGEFLSRRAPESPAASQPAQASPLSLAPPDLGGISQLEAHSSTFRMRVDLESVSSTFHPLMGPRHVMSNPVIDRAAPPIPSAPAAGDAVGDLESRLENLDPEMKANLQAMREMIEQFDPEAMESFDKMVDFILDHYEKAEQVFRTMNNFSAFPSQVRQERGFVDPQF